MLYRSTVVTGSQLGLETQSVEQAMLPRVEVAIHPEDRIKTAMRRMQDHGVIGLPVVSGRKVLGLVTQERLFDLMMSREDEAAIGIRTEGAVASLVGPLKN